MDTRRRLFQANNAYRRPQWWEAPWIAEAWTADIASTVTITGSDVDEWAPVKGTHSYTPLTTNPTIANGIISGNGTDQALVTDSFARAQPEYMFFAISPTTWTGGDCITDSVGVGSSNFSCFQVTGTPTIAMNAGSTVAANAGLVLGAFAVLTVCWNGASSFIRVNRGTATTGNAGANSGDGISLFVDKSASNFFHGGLKGVGRSSGVTLTAGELDQTIVAIGRRYGISV